MDATEKQVGEKLGWYITRGEVFFYGAEPGMWDRHATVGEVALWDALVASERQRAEERWIPVSEKLPEEGEIVLVVEDGQITTNFIPYSNSVSSTYRGRWNSGHPFVTHWRPLPAAPERSK